jgi:secreted trypsin-like serine protease
VRIESPETCKNSELSRFDEDVMLCVHESYLGGSCTGDSGGPLHCRRFREYDEQVGIVSFGISGTCRVSPSVYTDVSKLLPWIRNHIESIQTTLSPTIASTLPVLQRPKCQSITAYFTGTFKNQDNPDRYYPAQFEIKVTVNLTEERYHIITTHWNESVSKSDEFNIRFMASNSIKQ